MNEKICKRCGMVKNIEDFPEYKSSNGKKLRRLICIDCIREKDRIRYYTEKRTKYRKEYKEKNKKRQQEYMKEYYIKYFENNKDLLRKKSREYYYKNKEKINKRNAKRRITDDLFKIKCNIRNTLRIALNNGKSRTDNTLINLTGLNKSDLRNYLITTYEKNYNQKWKDEYLSLVEIDHIIPLATARTEEEVYILSNYKNLQLLKKKDNIEKRDNINFKLKREE